MSEKEPTTFKTKAIEKKKSVKGKVEGGTENGSEVTSKVFERKIIKELNALKAEIAIIGNKKNSTTEDEKRVLTVLEPKVRALEKELLESKIKEKSREQKELKQQALNLLRTQLKKFESENKNKKGFEAEAEKMQAGIYTLEEEISREISQEIGTAKVEAMKHEDSAVVEPAQENGEIATPEIADEGIKAGKTDSMLDVGPKNEEQVQALRDTLLKAYIDKSNDENIARFGGDVEKANALDVEKQAMEQKLKDEANENKLKSMMSWYEGDYDTAKKSQDQEQAIERVIGVEKPLSSKTSVEQAVTKESLVEKYGQDTIDRVNKMYMLKRRELVRQKITGTLLENRMALYKKEELQRELNKVVADKKPKQPETLVDMTKKKDEEKKKSSWWDRNKPAWWS